MARILEQCLDHRTTIKKPDSPRDLEGETLLPRDIPLNEIDQKDRDVHEFLPKANNLVVEPPKDDLKIAEELPRETSATNIDHPVESPVEKNFLRRSRVLLVEDNITNMTVSTS